MNLTITSLLNAYRNKTITPDKVIDEILSDCDQYEEHNIWITRLDRNQLQTYLKNLEGQSPDTLPLFGIPFAKTSILSKLKLLALSVLK